jgi:hypothetical protein
MGVMSLRITMPVYLFQTNEELLAFFQMGRRRT